MKVWEWVAIAVGVVAIAGGVWWYVSQESAVMPAPSSEVQAAPRRRKKPKGLLDSVGLGEFKGLAGGALQAYGTAVGGPVGAAVAAKASTAL